MISRLLLPVLIPLLTLVATAPDASAKPDYTGLTPSARSALQSFRSYMKDCDPDAPPHKGNDTVASHGLSQCERIIKNQRKRLDRIEGADRQHAVYKRFSKYQARLEKAYPIWVAEYEERRKKAGELQRTAVAMKNELRRASGTLWFLKDIADGKPRLGDRSANPGSAAKMVEAGQAIAALSKACRGTYAPVLADKKVLRWAQADRTPKPAEACELAGRWKSLLADWVPKAATAYAEIKRKQYQGFVDNITSKGKASDHILELLTADAMKTRVAEMLEAYRPLATAVGATISDDTFGSWNEVAAASPAAIKTASKVKRPRRKASNGKVTRALKASLKGSPLKFKKLGLTSKSGTIVKNGVGIPLRTAWSGDLLVQKKGEKFCRLYDVGAAAPYKGGGRYQKPISRGPGRHFQIAACK